MSATLSFLGYLARAWVLAALLLPLAACNAGRAAQGPVDAAPPMSPAPSAGAASSASIDSVASSTAAQPLPELGDKGRACKSDADCAIKDVGSCCGYRPQCLNKDTPTFPEQVKERCAREGRVSTCGVLAISGCQCVSGQCQGVLQADESLVPPAEPAPLQ